MFFLSWFWLFINSSSLIPHPARLLCVSAFRSSASIKTVTEGDQQISFLALLLNKWTCISISCLYLDQGHFEPATFGLLDDLLFLLSCRHTPSSDQCFFFSSSFFKMLLSRKITCASLRCRQVSTSRRRFRD